MRGPYVDPPVDELAAGYNARVSTRNLAWAFDVSASTVRNRLRAAGVQMRRRGAPLGNQHARKRDIK